MGKRAWERRAKPGVEELTPVVAASESARERERASADFSSGVRDVSASRAHPPRGPPSSALPLVIVVIVPSDSHIRIDGVAAVFC